MTATDDPTAARFAEVERSILARAPEHDLQPSLERIAAVMDLLGEPQSTYTVIHLTGTNGKTSTTRMTDTLLRELGLRTGRFTSPHLHDIRERIVIDGEPISQDAFLRIFDEVAPVIDIVDARSTAGGGPRMTYFEVLVAIALAAFADAPVQVAVIEVGMGGSWDATNVVQGAVSVVTPVGIDHQHFLGSTLDDIADEKAGIIKADAIAISAVQDDDVARILRDRADLVGARLVVEGEGIGILAREVAVGGQMVSLRGLAGDYPDLFLPLHGPHQAQNALLAIAAVEAFLGGGEQPLDLDLVRSACSGFTSPGRLEVVRRSPAVIVDAAHNPHGALALRAAIEDSFAFARLVGVIAVMADKDAEGILDILEPVLSSVVISRTTSPRAYDPHRLGALAVEIYGEDRVTVVPDLPDALDAAAAIADREAGVIGGVLATGSVVTAAEVRMLLGETGT